MCERENGFRERKRENGRRESVGICVRERMGLERECVCVNERLTMGLERERLKMALERMCVCVRDRQILLPSWEVKKRLLRLARDKDIHTYSEGEGLALQV